MRANKFFLALFLLFPFLASAQTGEIRGVVKNKNSNEPIPFANVVLQNTTIGTTTDIDGKYSIKNLKPGFYNVQVSYLGFKTQTVFEIQVVNSRPAIVNIEIEEDARSLQAVEVQASAFTRTEESPVSLRTIGVAEIQRNPGGNRDISRAIQSLPGVSSGASFRNDIIIRGGAPNENRFYLDGVEVPTINHFATQGSSGGPVGIINVDMIREVDFYSGAFPSNRGNTLSSVFEFKQKDPRTDKAAFRGIVGASDIGLIAEGPINEKLSYVVSARRSYLQFLFNAIGLPFLPTFNGFQGKVKYKIDNQNEVYFVGLGAIDQFALNTGLNLSYDPAVNPNVDSQLVKQQRYILGNLPVNTQWNYTNGLVYKRYRKNGYHTFVLSRNMLNNVSFKYQDNDESKLKLQDFKSQESENRFRYENNIRTEEGWKINYGVNIDRARYFVENNTNDLVGSTIVNRNFSNELFLTRYGFFGQVSKGFFGEILVLSAGLRVDGNNFAESMRNPLDQFSPRFSLSYNFAPKLSFNANVGRYYQLPAYTVLGFRDNAGNLVNRDNGVKYIGVDHYVAGLEYFGKKNFRSTLEGFYKNYFQYPFLLDQGVSLANLGSDFGVIGNAPVTSTNSGRSYGIEYLAQQKLSKGFYGIFSYTWVRSEFQNAAGEFIPSAWDNRNIFTLTGGKIFKKNWELGVRYRYVGGAPITPYDPAITLTRSVWDVQQRPVFDFANLNTQRGGPTQQLDIRIDKKWNFEKWAFNFYVDVQNLLNQQTVLNPFIVAKIDPATGAPIVDPNDPTRYLADQIPNTAGTRLPTIGIIVDF
ncbi:MAG: ferric aerobactin receptor [Sphingobacteriaceae bacterium]|nr:ferric aerobactin receptor [Sphingobacteriaceae bacterium]